MKPVEPAGEVARAQEQLQALQAELARLRAERDELQSKYQALEVIKHGMETQLQEALRELAELRRQLFGCPFGKRAGRGGGGW